MSPLNTILYLYLYRPYSRSALAAGTDIICLYPITVVLLMSMYKNKTAAKLSVIISGLKAIFVEKYFCL